MSISAPSSSALPPIDPAREPAVIRNGDQKAKDAYATGLGFEEVLVNELVQQMAQTVPGLDGSSDGSSDSSDSSGDGSSSGVMGSTSSLGAYASLLPSTLSQSIMSAGGTGIAMQIAQSLDPALLAAPPSSKK